MAMAVEIGPSQFWVFALILIYVIHKTYVSLHNIYHHPLAGFAGPRTTAFSNFRHCYWFLGGRQPYKLLDLHMKYGNTTPPSLTSLSPTDVLTIDFWEGSVVRTAPNELSFNSPQSWKDIYGFRPAGHQTFIKSDFYDGGSFADRDHSIISERDPTEHGKMRKFLSQAFSDRSLMEQENLIAEVIDQFIEVIGKRGAQELDICQAFEMMTFDIIGSLAFGEEFGGVKSGERHPWITVLLSALNKGALVDTLNRFPVIAWVFMRVMPGTIERIIKDTKKNEEYAIKLTKKRINQQTDRKDFLTRILEHRDPKEVSDIQIAAHSSDFVLAGSETTATALSCITYYLLRTPHVMQTLQQEIRGAFKSYDQINAASAARLTYLNAVVLEGLRIFPPVPFALPRVVPTGGDIVDGHFVPEGTIVATNPVATSLSPANFKEPMTFEPTRWLEKNPGDVLEASQPFSLGPRGCIGRSLAWVELRTTLAKLHYTYDLKLLDDKLDWHRDVRMQSLWQKPELKVQVLSRPKVSETEKSILI